MGQARRLSYSVGLARALRNRCPQTHEVSGRTLRWPRSARTWGGHRDSSHPEINPTQSDLLRPYPTVSDLKSSFLSRRAGQNGTSEVQQSRRRQMPMRWSGDRGSGDRPNPMLEATRHRHPLPLSNGPASLLQWTLNQDITATEKAARNAPQSQLPLITQTCSLAQRGRLSQPAGRVSSRASCRTHPLRLSLSGSTEGRRRGRCLRQQESSSRGRNTC